MATKTKYRNVGFKHKVVERFLLLNSSYDFPEFAQMAVKEAIDARLRLVPNNNEVDSNEGAGST